MVRADDLRDAVSVTWPQVHAFRMARHHLDYPASKTKLARVVADACGIQAQVMAAAQLALRVRVRNLTLEDVGRALWKERSLARVWCMRGTVHLVPSDEFAVFVRGPSTRQQDRVASWIARSGARREAVEQLVGAATAAIGQPRTRAEIAARIHDALGWPIEKRGSRGWGSPSDVAGFRLGCSVVTVPDIAWLASYRCLVCFGPDDGHGTTFVRPDAWLPEWRDLPLEDAEDNLLRRYLQAFGPATVSDFAAWSVLALRRAREIWSRIAGELVPVDLEGRITWVLRRDRFALDRARPERPTVRLLPYFDSFLMGHKERRHLVDKAHHKRIYRPAGWVYPTVLVDGVVAGEWSHLREAKRLRVRVKLYAPLDEATKDLVREEAEDVARFLGGLEARTTFAKAR